METYITDDYKNGVFAVESGYEGGGIVSIYILRGGNEAAIVDTAHNGALEPVKNALAELNIKESEVKYIFLTHVHLDHSGGAGQFARAFPDSTFIVHERGARHVTDPSKLAASAASIYGETATKRLYGDIQPVPRERIIIPRDGDEFRVGNKTVVCFDTPGHARHHLAYKDMLTGSVFTGDSYGMSYKELVKPYGRCALLTTSPVQFDPQAMASSMKRIDALAAGTNEIYPTHYGRMPLDGISESLYRQLDLYVEAAERTGGELDMIRAALRELFKEEAERQGCPCFASDSGRVTGTALELNAQGLSLWYKKTKQTSNKE